MKQLRRMAVVAVSLDRTRFLFQCENGHRFWQKQYLGKGRLRRPMDSMQASFFSIYWRPGQGCYGPCKKCDRGE